MTDSLRSRLNTAVEKLGTHVPAVNQLQHTLKQQVALHNPNQAAETLKLQLLNKALSSVSLDQSALGRELKLFSKNLYLWGKDEKGEDLVDISDRLAWLMFKTGEVNEAHAAKLEESRRALKDIRNSENELVFKRQQRLVLVNKLAAFQQAHPKPNASNTAAMSKLSTEITNFDQGNASLESSLSSLKRLKLRECFDIQFASQKELGEKLAIIASYGQTLTEGLKSEGVNGTYTGKEQSAWIRKEADAELAAWKPQSDRRPYHTSEGGSSSLNRADTMSFGSTHATELSHLPSDYETTSSENQPEQFSPPTSSLPPPPPHHPTSPTSSLHQTLPFDTDATIVNEPPRPTLVDTGTPILAGTGGPSQGQLKPRLSSLTSEGGAPISLASIGGGVPSPTSGASGAQLGADARSMRISLKEEAEILDLREQRVEERNCPPFTMRMMIEVVEPRWKRSKFWRGRGRLKRVFEDSRMTFS